MQDIAFGAQLLTLPNIFENKLFTIPDYQRGYAWEEKQVQELLRDIDHLLDDGVVQRHYTGTLVLSRHAGEEEVGFHVVDGQQRLTTLIILMRMIAEHLSSNERDDFERLYLRRGEIGSDHSVLRLNVDTRAFFESVILGDGNTTHEPPTLESHHRLLQTRKLIKAWLAGRIANGTSIAQVRDSVETEIGFIVFAPREDSETGIMFEVINNRGKTLSELEKVKNYLIYCSVKLAASTLRGRIDNEWSGILRNLNAAGKTSPSEEGAFLRYCMAVHFRLNKTDSQYGYDELKKKVRLEDAIKSPDGKGSAIGAITQFVAFLKAASLWYARLYGQQHVGLDKSLVEVLDQIRGQDRQASIMPMILALLIKNEGQGARLIQLLKLLEVLNFRVYMARNITARNDTGQGELYDLAGSYYQGALLSYFDEGSRIVGCAILANDEDALEYSLVRFVLQYAPDMLFAESFRLEQAAPTTSSSGAAYVIF